MNLLRYVPWSLGYAQMQLLDWALHVRCQWLCSPLVCVCRYWAVVQQASAMVHPEWIGNLRTDRRKRSHFYIRKKKPNQPRVPSYAYVRWLPIQHRSLECNKARCHTRPGFSSFNVPRWSVCPSNVGRVEVSWL